MPNSSKRKNIGKYGTEIDRMPSVLPEEAALWNDGDKIKAVKNYRNRTNCTLAAATDCLTFAAKKVR